MRAIAVFMMGALLALPASAGPLEFKLFGTEMGGTTEYVCFLRHYDNAHLKSHPQQNVTDMALLVSGLPDGDGFAYFGLGMGVRFRGVENELVLGGGCGTNENGEQLNCGIDCDGGTIDVTLGDENSVRVEIRVMGGAVNRVPVDATAYAHRTSKIMVNVAAFYEALADKPTKQAWVDGLSAALAQGNTGAYVNFVGDEGPERVRAAYPGKTWDRLREIKRAYDPDNVFRLNQNIPPAAS